MEDGASLSIGTLLGTHEGVYSMGALWESELLEMSIHRELREIVGGLWNWSIYL
jgi:hypothetical protein